MLLTEEEATKRWCPFARNVVAVHDDENRMISAVNANRFDPTDNRPSSQPRCLASQCMAWRWEQIRQPVPGKDPLAETQVKLVQGERGWCGLAERGRGPFG